MRGKITFQHLEIKVGPNEVLQKFQHGKVAKDENQKLYFIIMIFGLMTGNTTERSSSSVEKKNNSDRDVSTGHYPPIQRRSNIHQILSTH